MKKCSEISELISLYIDDELNADQRSELEAHAASCEECGKELNELMQIVGLCRNVTEEELPANFKTELHQKLLEVQKQSEEAYKPAFYQHKYFKLFSSVAAVFLLVFLIRGFYNFDLLSGMKTKSSNDMFNMAAETTAGNELQMKAAGQEAAPEAADTMDKNISGFQSAGKAAGEATVSCTEIDRSTTEDRENKTGTDGAGVNESITKNTASIIISVDDPAAQAEKVKQAARTSSGLDQQQVQPGENGDSYTSEEGMVLQLSIPNMQLNAFVDTLNKDYGQDNVRAETVIAEDMTVTFEELLYEVDKLDIMIENAEKGNEESVDDLAQIKEQKAELQSKIDALRMESDLTNVKIILKKK